MISIHVTNRDKMVQYTPESFRLQYEAIKKFQEERKKVEKGVSLPADISESIVQFILNKKGDKTCRKASKGDLVSDIEGVLQVKSFTSDGPTSFGAKTYWDVIYFLDGREWKVNDRYRLYRIAVASDDPRWRGLYFTESKTFGEMVESPVDRDDKKKHTPVRPRCSFEKIRTQLGNLCEMVYEGDINDILDIPPLPPLPVHDSGLRVVDLFAGTGAFSMAFGGAVFANDMVDASKRLYELNVGHTLTLGDLNDIPVEQIPAHDVLTGGFPCQPFSIAGQQKGFADSRANIFFKILEIVRHHRPSCILLENVKNIIRHDPFSPDEQPVPIGVLSRSPHLNTKKFGRTITTITGLLEAEGYHLHIQVIDTADVSGIPQHRERMYLTGFREERHLRAVDLVLPTVDKRPLSDFLEETVPDKYYYTRNRYKKEIMDRIHEIVREEGVLYQYRRTIVRENKSMECPTLTANMGGGGHNVPLLIDKNGVRKLTPRECFNLQGFPETYSMSRALCDGAHYRLAGNAVTFPVVRELARRIVAVLRD